MIEINSSIHHSPTLMYSELNKMKSFLLMQANKMGVKISGGGTHPFQQWAYQKIFPTLRFKNLAHQYQYLSKCSTVFGQHVHIGCESGEDALYLTHTLARFIPQLIAISASSPFYQGVDTGFQSSRSNVFSAYPLSGVIPYLTTWKEFSAYFYKMRKLKIIHSMKDFYWDIRPKPEFGTVEVRVCDTPLTIKKAALITAYIQVLSYYLLHEKPFLPTHDLYFLYGYNRFQAVRYGLDGEFINPFTLQRSLIFEDILNTIKLIQPHILHLNNSHWIEQLKDLIVEKQNDATKLKNIFKDVGSLPHLVQEQCLMWEQD